jgi:hypothetical protein
VCGACEAAVLEWVCEQDFGTLKVRDSRVLVNNVRTAVRSEYAHPFKIRRVWLTSSNGFQMGGAAEPRAYEGGFARPGYCVDDDGLLEG